MLHTNNIKTAAVQPIILSILLNQSLPTDTDEDLIEHSHFRKLIHVWREKSSIELIFYSVRQNFIKSLLQNSTKELYFSFL